MPCVRHPLEVTGIHGTDTHVWCPVLVVLDTHGHNADTMNQIPIEPIPIPMPCVVWHPVELLHFIAIRGSCRRRCSYHAVTGIHGTDIHVWHPVLVVLDTHGHDADTMRGVFYADAVFASCGDCCRCSWD